MILAVPFTVNSDKEREEGDFDAWFASVTSGFGDEGVYEATLPLYRALDWWRYAKPSDLHNTSMDSADTSLVARIRSVVDAVMQWWTGDAETRYGVPVLPYDKQLPIYTEGEGVLFSCVGEKMVWPDELLGKQRVNREKRDGEERRKAEEKRRGREGRE